MFNHYHKKSQNCFLVKKNLYHLNTGYFCNSKLILYIMNTGQLLLLI